MSRLQHFSRLCAELERANFDVIDARYEGRHFGSWYIEVGRQGLLQRQIAFDGRDGLMTVRVRDASGFWSDDWHASDASHQSFEALMAKLG